MAFRATNLWLDYRSAKRGTASCKNGRLKCLICIRAEHEYLNRSPSRVCALADVLPEQTVLAASRCHRQPTNELGGRERCIAIVLPLHKYLPGHYESFIVLVLIFQPGECQVMKSHCYLWWESDRCVSLVGGLNPIVSCRASAGFLAAEEMLVPQGRSRLAMQIHTERSNTVADDLIF